MVNPCLFLQWETKEGTTRSMFSAGFLNSLPFDILDLFFPVGDCPVHCMMF